MILLINCIKALHAFSFIAFMAGIFYLPRIFVYHVGVKKNSDSFKLFCTMEKRLIKFIMTPAIILTYLTGGYLLYSIMYVYQNYVWLIVKLLCVLAMTSFYFICWKFVKEFESGHCKKSNRFFRVFNEIPTILLLIILFMVYLKPF